MNYRYTFIYIIAMLFMATVMACSDHDDGLSSPKSNALKLSETDVELSDKAQYYTITADIDSAKASTLRVKNDAEWCTVADTVAYDGVIELLVDANDDTPDRSTTLYIVDGTDSSQAPVATLNLTQHGIGYSGSNDDGTEKFRVGYGYNVFNEFNSDVSTVAPIFDMNKIKGNNNEMVRNMIQNVPRSREEVTHIVANSAYEMATLMEKYYNKTTKKCTGSKKTISRFTSQTSYELDVTNYCYIKLTRTVASAALDYSVLQYCIDNDINIYNDDFNNAKEAIINNPDNTEQIDNFLTKFGTHIVTATDLGGMMDLALNFSRTMKGEANLRAEDFSDFFFNNDKSDYLDLNGKIDGLESTVGATGTFKIVGGDKTISKKIQEFLSDGGQQITSDDMLAWQRSIEGNPLEDQALLDRLAAVNFTLAPIWNLFPVNVSPCVYDRVLVMAQKSNNNLSDYITNPNNYHFLIRGDKLTSFGTDDESTLVKVVYASNSGSPQPVLEVCNEYVPKLRTDRRVNVIYGINKGCTFHGAGLFPGDGEGNPPAWLTFSDGDCYVRPIDGYGANDVIDTVYYMRGNIYVTNYKIKTSRPTKLEVKDYYLTLSYGKKVEYPIVKIGSGYWSRKNVSQKMNWDNEHTESVNNKDMLYARVYQNTSTMFEALNKEVFGTTTDDTGQRCKWYLPIAEDRQNLTKYVGSNLKVLFPNQVSGFEAEFVGYYGQCDKHGWKIDSQPSLRNRDYCFVTFKECEKDNQGEVFILSSNYTWESVPLDGCDNNYYPIRLFRTSNFIYK